MDVILGAVFAKGEHVIEMASRIAAAVPTLTWSDAKPLLEVAMANPSPGGFLLVRAIVAAHPQDAMSTESLAHFMSAGVPLESLVECVVCSPEGSRPSPAMWRNLLSHAELHATTLPCKCASVRLFSCCLSWGSLVNSASYGVLLAQWLARLSVTPGPQWSTQFHELAQCSLRFLAALLAQGSSELALSVLSRLFSLCSSGTTSPCLFVVLQGFGEAPIASAASFAVSGSSDLQLQSVLESLSMWPLTNTVTAWLVGIIQALCQAQRYVVLGRTVSTVASNAALQLYVAPCRQGALILLREMLCGYQLAPNVFHGLLPLFSHVFVYLSEEAQLAVTSIDCVVSYGHAIQELHALFRAEAPPKFDPSIVRARAASAKDADVRSSVANLVQDLMSLFAGYNDRYEALMEIIHAHLEPPERMADVGSLRRLAWGGAQPFSGSSLGGFFGAGAASSQQDSQRREEGVPVGLINVGNTCYMNSCVQSLFAMAAFQEEISKQPPSKNKVVEALQSVFARLSLSVRRSINPGELLGVLPEMYRQGRQEDASELSKVLLDCCDSGVFTGSTVTCITCAHCGTVSERAEGFVDLPLAVPGEASADLSVESLLAGMLEVEQMIGDNMYHCSVCAQLRDAQCLVYIKEAPPNLVVTLKRFGFSNGAPHKILTPVSYQLKLRVPLREHQAEGGICYELRAVVMHSGKSAQYGHYYAYIRLGQQWFLCNDGFVKRASFQQFSAVSKRFATDVPYMLYYTREGEEQVPVVIPAGLKSKVMSDNAKVK